MPSELKMAQSGEGIRRALLRAHGREVVQDLSQNIPAVNASPSAYNPSHSSPP